MHVAVLMAGSDLGGAERSLLSLVRSAAGAMRFTLLLPAAGELSHEARAAGAGYCLAPWPARLLALGERSGPPSLATLAGAVPAIRRAALVVRERLDAIRADVLVTNGIKPHVVGALAVRGRPGVPLIWYLRESSEGRRFSRGALAIAGTRCDAAIAISSYVAGDARRYLPRAVSIAVAYNIVSVPIGAGDEGAHDLRGFTRVDGECWFATIGGLTALKGLDVFLHAAAIVSRELPATRFLIVGANRYAPEQHTGYDARLRRLVRDLGLEHRVVFLGHRRDVPAVLRHIDVLVQPNTAPEGFGRSVAEAMTAGVPVIASRAWSFLELIEDDVTGWLVPPGDVTALARRMLAAARDPEARRAVAERARVFVGEATRAERCVAAFGTAIEAATAKRTGMQPALA